MTGKTYVPASIYTSVFVILLSFIVFALALQVKQFLEVFLLREEKTGTDKWNESGQCNIKIFKTSFL